MVMAAPTYVSAVHLSPIEGLTVVTQQRNRTFTDKEDEFGLGLLVYATQAAFFDYTGRDLERTVSPSAHLSRRARTAAERDPWLRPPLRNDGIPLSMSLKRPLRRR